MTKLSNNTIDMYTAQDSQRLANQLASDVRASRESKVPDHMWVSRNGRVWSDYISSAAIAGLDECMIPCGPDGVRRFEGWLEEEHGPGNWWIGEWKKENGGPRVFSSVCPICDNPSVKGRHKPYCRNYVLGLTTTSKSLYSDASTGSGKKKTLRKKGELSRYFSKKVDELEDQIQVHLEKRFFKASSEVQKKLVLALWIMVAEDLERVPRCIEDSVSKGTGTIPWWLAATRIQAVYRGKSGRAVARRLALSKKISRIRKEIYGDECRINDADVVSGACECLGIDMSKITENDERVITIYMVTKW